jgi:deoxyribonuclease V
LTPALAVLDVHYSGEVAHAACVVAESWTAAEPSHAVVERVEGVAEYEPGSFYKRELPPLLAVLSALTVMPATLIVDGYVWLDLERPGLGAVLDETLHGPSIVGVAKTEFFGNRAAASISRHGTRPLFVTAIGVEIDAACRLVASMHGAFRVPTLLRFADRLARTQ